MQSDNCSLLFRNFILWSGPNNNFWMERWRIGLWVKQIFLCYWFHNQHHIARLDALVISWSFLRLTVDRQIWPNVIDVILTFGQNSRCFDFWILRRRLFPHTSCSCCFCNQKVFFKPQIWPTLTDLISTLCKNSSSSYMWALFILFTIWLNRRIWLGQPFAKKLLSLPCLSLTFISMWTLGFRRAQLSYNWEAVVGIERSYPYVLHLSYWCPPSLPHCSYPNVTNAIRTLG